MAVLVVVIAGCSILSQSNAGIDPGPEPPLDPSATLPGSLHGTSGGMEWWYTQADGAQAVFGVEYASTGCATCHTDSCDDCHGDTAGKTPAQQPDKCLVCHGRLQKEAQLEVTDVHFTAGFKCSDCHSLAAIHGDGNTYDSMFDAAALSPACTDCHNATGGSGAPVPTTQSHTIHGETLACDACHVSTVITCYNCHFETLLNSHEKKPAAAFKNFIILLNDANGKVRAGTYQSAVYGDKTFVAFGPYHGHAITGAGRACTECHGSARMTEYRDTGKIQMTWWDAATSKVQHTTGVIPFVPDDMEFQFVTLNGADWVPLNPAGNAASQVSHDYQYKFCSPLTTEQLNALGATVTPSGPEATLGSSLHGTARGMEWWYTQADGAGDFFNVPYSETGCGTCHTDSCADCHANADGTGGVDQPAVCVTCHGRAGMEQQLGLTDLHMDNGMVCSDCHSLAAIHGDGNSYNTMFDASALNPQCADCHSNLDNTITEHAVHGASFNCDACHVQSSITCYNCHFQTLLDSHEKKPAGAFKDFALLLNDADGKIRLGSYQSLYYDGKGFVAFGPYHGHNVTAAGRHCDACHGNDRIREYTDTGKIVMTTWDAGQSKVTHTTGVIPFVPDDFEFQFLDLSGTTWSPVTPTETLYQTKFASPLDADQLAAMARPMPTKEQLAGSLHGTAAGMAWWYNQPNGLGSLLNLDYTETGCGGCHIDTTAADGGCSQCHGANPVSAPIAGQAALCSGCHGRQAAELAMSLPDVHKDAGMECSACHLSDVHGDGTAYNSMFAEGAIDADCETCHPTLDTTIPEHAQHSDQLYCDACHLTTVITCYNCHFDSLLTDHVKKPYKPFAGFVLLVNDPALGKVRAGTYQSVIEGGTNTFIAFGPYHGHSVSAVGRHCADCHDSARITELNNTGKIVMTTWDAGATPPGLTHTTGIVPFVPSALEFTFVDYDKATDTWSPVGTQIDRLQYEFCEPLTAEQLTALGVE
jgi:hypothetical protein